MKDCKQHFPVVIESITAVKPVTGKNKWLKEGVVYDVHAARITKVLKLKCFSCGEVIELNKNAINK